VQLEDDFLDVTRQVILLTWGSLFIPLCRAPTRYYVGSFNRDLGKKTQKMTIEHHEPHIDGPAMRVLIIRAFSQPPSLCSPANTLVYIDTLHSRP